MRDALPKASFIGFTGTPIESGDKKTQAVFGDLGGVPNTCVFDSL
jgi:type I restriction enzyme R subunit